MKNITNAYLVLSVADIRNMLRAAELEQQVRGTDQESVTIVLEDITVYADDGQIASWTVAQAVAKCVAESKEDLTHGSWAAQKSACMNHSDAAI